MFLVTCRKGIVTKDINMMSYLLSRDSYQSEYDQIWLDEGQLKIKESSKTTSNSTPTKKTGGPAHKAIR